MPLVPRRSWYAARDFARDEEADVWVSLSPGFPEVNLQIAPFDEPATLSPTWVDITERIRTAQWGPVGRGQETDRSGGSSATFVLSNLDRHLDSNYASSPWVGEFHRAWKVRLRVRWDGVVYPRWAGYKTGITLSWPSVGFDAVATLKATGPFRRLQLADFGQFEYPEQLAGERITQVLTDIGVDPSEMEIDAGEAVVAALDNLDVGEVRRPLPHLLDVAESDDGFLWEGLDGKIMYHDGLHRIFEERTVAAVFGDAGDEARMEPDATVTEDDTLIRNVVSITPTRVALGGVDPGGTAEVHTDSTSVTDHFDRAYERVLLMVDQGVAASYALHQLDRYAQPQQRVPAVSLIGANPQTDWADVLARDLSDRVEFVRRPRDANGDLLGEISQEAHIEALSETFDRNYNWRTTAHLSPAYTPAFPYRMIDTDDIDDTSVLIY